MKIKKDVDILIKENYKGAMVSFEDDIGKFFAVKRIIKKHISKNTLTDDSNQEKSQMTLINLLNQVSLLKNVFKEDIILDVFEEVLENDEFAIMLSLWHCMGYSKESYNKDFENKVFAILRMKFE